MTEEQAATQIDGVTIANTDGIAHEVNADNLVIDPNTNGDLVVNADGTVPARPFIRWTNNDDNLNIEPGNATTYTTLSTVTPSDSAFAFSNEKGECVINISKDGNIFFDAEYFKKLSEVSKLIWAQLSVYVAELKRNAEVEEAVKEAIDVCETCDDGTCTACSILKAALDAKVPDSNHIILTHGTNNTIEFTTTGNVGLGVTAACSGTVEAIPEPTPEEDAAFKKALEYEYKDPTDFGVPTGLVSTVVPETQEEDK